MLGLDAVDAVEIGHQEARAGGPAGHRGEAGPAEPAAPQRGHRAVHHHPGAVARRVEEDGLEVAVPLVAQPVEHVAREHDQARAARPEGHRLAPEIRDGAIGRVGAHHEHAGGGEHRGQHAQVGGRAADAGERLVGDLALHQPEIERARLEQRHVLGAALRVAGPHVERGIRLVDDRGHRLAVDRESAARAWRCRGSPWSGLGVVSLTARTVPQLSARRLDGPRARTYHSIASRPQLPTRNLSDLVEGGVRTMRLPRDSSHQSEDGFADHPASLPQPGPLLAARGPARGRGRHPARPLRGGADRREHRVDRLRPEGGPGRPVRDDELREPRVRDRGRLPGARGAGRDGRRAPELHAPGGAQALRRGRDRRGGARARPSSSTISSRARCAAPTGRIACTRWKACRCRGTTCSRRTAT